MKSTLLIISLFTASLASAAQTEVHTSVAGHTFTQVTNHPELGDAFVDETGLIWGDVVMKAALSQATQEKFCAQGSSQPECNMTQAQAIQFCASIGAQLPSKDQFIQLDKLIGDSTTTMDINGNFTQDSQKVEVIPNLPSRSYWSSTLNPAISNPALAFAFEYGADAELQVQSNDLIDDYAAGGSSYTRCVRQN